MWPPSVPSVKSNMQLYICVPDTWCHHRSPTVFPRGWDAGAQGDAPRTLYWKGTRWVADSIAEWWAVHLPPIREVWWDVYMRGGSCWQSPTPWRGFDVTTMLQETVAPIGMSWMMPKNPPPPATPSTATPSPYLYTSSRVTLDTDSDVKQRTETLNMHRPSLTRPREVCLHWEEFRYFTGRRVSVYRGDAEGLIVSSRGSSPHDKSDARWRVKGSS